MSNQYGRFMGDFFRDLDRETEADPQRLALAFAARSWNNDPRHYFQRVELPADRIGNVSILVKDTPLPFVSQRATLVADTTILTHHRETPHQFWSRAFNPEPIPGGWVLEQRTACSIRCPDLVALGCWLRDAKPLLLAGDLFYFPDLLIARDKQRDPLLDPEPDDYESSEHEESVAPLCRLIVENRKLIGPRSPRDAVRADLVRPVLSLQLPYLETTSFADFCRISADERRPFARFRDLLRVKLLDLKQNEGSETAEKGLAKIGAELREGVAQVGAELDSLKRKRAIETTGASVMSVTATLLAVSGALPGLAPLLGGGGVALLLKAVAEYEAARKRAEASPHYYLWALQRAATRS